MRHFTKPRRSTLLIVGGILAVFGIFSAANNHRISSTSPAANTDHITAPMEETSQEHGVTPQAAGDSIEASPGQPESLQSAPASTSTPLSPSDCMDGTYVNSSGNTVCSPGLVATVPADVTARCADGTFSFSQHHSGTCSHHGGVAAWL